MILVLFVVLRLILRCTRTGGGDPSSCDGRTVLILVVPAQAGVILNCYDNRYIILSCTRTSVNVNI